MPMTNNHTNAIISQVNIGNVLYDIHDANAVHSFEDLGLIGALRFMGVKQKYSDLTSVANPQVGDVWHVIERDSEYVWVQSSSPSVAGNWEEFGSKFIIDHQHPVTVTGTISGTAAAQKWTQTSGSIDTDGSAAAQKWTQGTSTVVVSGTNAASAVTGKTAVSITTPTHKYLSAALASTPTFTPSTEAVLGDGTTASASGTAVAGTGTAPAITGFGTHSKDTAIKSLSSTTPTKVTIPNVTNVGTASTWNFTVNSGVLTISGTNSTVPTLGTVLTASKIGSGAVTPVYTGVEATITAITELGTANTTDCLTGVTVTKDPTITITPETINAAVGGTISKPGVTLTANTSTGSGRIQYTETTTNTDTDRDLKSGSAAAQKWTQGTSSVTVSGTNAASKVTGSVVVTGQNAASAVTGTCTASGTTGTAVEKTS